MATDTWQVTPLKYPHECAITHNGEEANGPYFETRLEFLEPFVEDGQIRVKPKLNTLYLSETAIREACNVPGSPLVVLRVEVYDLAMKLAGEASDERDRLGKLLDEAYADIEVLTKHIKPETESEPELEVDK